MSEFIILGSDHPANSMCSFCVDPGKCCRKFKLFESKVEKTFWKADGVAAAVEELKSRDLPFSVQETSGEWIDEETGQPYVAYWYSCPWLTPEGRCGRYNDRPDLCRRFVAGSNTLCAMTTET